MAPRACIFTQPVRMSGRIRSVDRAANRHRLLLRVRAVRVAGTTMRIIAHSTRPVAGAGAGSREIRPPGIVRWAHADIARRRAGSTSAGRRPRVVRPPDVTTVSPGTVPALPVQPGRSASHILGAAGSGGGHRRRVPRLAVARAQPLPRRAGTRQGERGAGTPSGSPSCIGPFSIAAFTVFQACDPSSRLGSNRYVRLHVGGGVFVKFQRRKAQRAGQRRAASPQKENVVVLTERTRSPATVRGLTLGKTHPFTPPRTTM